MKMRKFITLSLALLMLCAILAGCGGSSRTEAAAPAAEANYAVAEDTAVSLTANSAAGSTALPESRKWIITVHMTAETEDLDAMTAALDERINSMNGYVEDQRIYNGSSYASRRYRNANLTIRIPAEDVDKFTEEVSGIANVVNKEKSLEDVTLNYVATESRMNALQTEESRLLDLLAQAETMSDLLEIEARLTDVRYELERVTSQLRLYDNQIDYATIYLNIEEVQEYTPVEEPTFWERITEGFADSLDGLWESLQDLLVWLVVSSPFLLVYGGAAFVIIFVTLRIRKNKGEKKTKNKKHLWKDKNQTNGEETE